MAELSFYIGVIGNVISVLVFLSPVETFWKIVKRRSTEEYKSLPYICTLLGSSLWTYYGIVTPGEYLVSTVNGFGALVETIYVSLFLFYAPRHLKFNTMLVVAMLNVFFPIAAIVATRSAFTDEKMRSQSIGFISAGLNIIMYGSPLSAMDKMSSKRIKSVTGGASKIRKKKSQEAETKRLSGSILQFVKITPKNLDYLISPFMLLPLKLGTWNVALVTEKMADELVEMFKREVMLKRLLIMELVSLSSEIPQPVNNSCWSDELYHREFDDLTKCSLYSMYVSEPVLPRVKENNLGISSISQKTVVTTKSVKYMPFWLSFFLFLNGAIWSVYASLHHDVFLLVPNGVGFVFGTMQLILYGIYRNAKPVGLSNGVSEIAIDEEEGLTSRAPLLS